METAEFAKGIENLIDVATRNRAVIMCAEALWWQCHRGLIADYLKSRAWRVLHIMGPAKIEEHPYTSAARMLEGRLSYEAADQLPLR
jgi:uncharacterized protein (DUF488 family)